MKIVLLSWATGSVSSGNLSAFDVISSKECEIVSYATDDARLLILLPMETRYVARGNTVILRPKLRHQTSVVPYSTDTRSKDNYPAKINDQANERTNDQVNERMFLSCTV